MIAFVDDFKLMLILTLAVIPLLWLINPASKKSGSAELAHAAMD
jgi:DHA2 family multidrug resistance protein